MVCADSHGYIGTVARLTQIDNLLDEITAILEFTGAGAPC